MTTIAFLRRGVLLAAGDAAGNVRLWDFASRKPLPLQIPGQGHVARSLAFDRLGERIATACDERCIRIWHIDSGRQLAILNLALGTPIAIRYTPDGRSLAGSTTAGGLFLWDSDSYRPKTVLRAEGNPLGQDAHASVITCSAATADGKLLTGSSDKSVKLWDMKTRKFLANVLTTSQIVSSLALSPDGRKLAVGTGRYRTDFEPGELVVYDFNGGDARPLPQLRVAKIAATAAAFTPDGSALAYCGLLADDARGTRRDCGIINLATSQAAAVKTAEPLSLAFAPGGRTLAIGQAGRQCRAVAARFVRSGRRKADGAPRPRRGGELHRLRTRRQIARHRRLRQQRQDLGPGRRRRTPDLQAQRHRRGGAFLVRRPHPGHRRPRGRLRRHSPLAGGRRRHAGRRRRQAGPGPGADANRGCSAAERRSVATVHASTGRHTVAGLCAGHDRHAGRNLPCRREAPATRHVLTNINSNSAGRPDRVGWAERSESHQMVHGGAG